MNLLIESVKAALEGTPERETLGDEISIHVSRLVFTALFDLGTAGEGLLYHGGVRLGEALVETGDVGGESVRMVLERLLSVIAKLKLGVPSIVSADDSAAVVRNEECYFCSGMPDVGHGVCFFEAGVISGALTKALRKEFVVKETKCQSMGEQFCEYEIRGR